MEYFDTKFMGRRCLVLTDLSTVISRKLQSKTSYSISGGVNVEFRNLTGSPCYGLRKTFTCAWEMAVLS